METSKRKKVFYINCSPAGSTGKIITDTAEEIKKSGWDSCFCFPSGEAKSGIFEKIYKTSLPFEQGILRRITEMTGDSFGFAPVSTARIISALKKEKPDVVHLHCINSHMVDVIKLISWLKNNKIPTVITNHCEMFYTGNCAHAYECEKWLTGCGNCGHLSDYLCGIKRDRTARCWQDMKKAFEGFERAVMTSVSPWVYERSSASPITAGIKQEIVTNGIDTDVFCQSPDPALRSKLKINENAKIVLNVTAYFDLSGENRIHGENKGSKYVMELAEKLRDKNLVFVVAGSYYGVSKIPDNMRFLGRVNSREELAKIYSLADLTLVTSRRETFGMSVAESLCCGTPVVGFRSGGSESVAIPGYSEFCDFGDSVALEGFVEKWINRKNNDLSSSEISESAKTKYDKRIMAEKYLKIYETLAVYR